MSWFLIFYVFFFWTSPCVHGLLDKFQCFLLANLRVSLISYSNMFGFFYSFTHAISYDGLMQLLFFLAWISPTTSLIPFLINFLVNVLLHYVYFYCCEL